MSASDALRPPVWAIVGPSTPLFDETVEGCARRIDPDPDRLADEAAFPGFFLQRNAGWSAAYHCDLDQVDSEEVALATCLSKSMTGDVFLLYFDLDETEHEHSVISFSKGRRKQGFYDCPFEFAEARGVVLPGKPREPEGGDRWAVVVPAVTPEIFAERAADQVALDAYTLAPCRVGCYLTDDCPPTMPWGLSELFGLVYHVVLSPERFSCELWRDGDIEF